MIARPTLAAFGRDLFSREMGGLMLRKIFIAAVFAAPLAGLAPEIANAQELSRGDYEKCAVYDRDGDFAGYDSACLERTRAQIRHYQRSAGGSGSSYNSGVYYCPSWANGGRGYNATWYSDGRSPSYYGTYDSTSNGRPCIPNPTYQGTGYY